MSLFSIRPAIHSYLLHSIEEPLISASAIPSMTLVDYLLLILILLFALKGIFTGLVREVLSLAGFVSGILLAYGFYPLLARELIRYMQGFEYLSEAVAFFLIFLVVVVIFKILASFITGLLMIVRLSWLNRLLGGVAGVVKGGILSLFIINTVLLIPLPEGIKDSISSSYVVGILLEFSRIVASIFYKIEIMVRAEAIRLLTFGWS